MFGASRVAAGAILVERVDFQGIAHFLAVVAAEVIGVDGAVAFLMAAFVAHSQPPAEIS
jgi:hypothetical protein